MPDQAGHGKISGDPNKGLYGFIGDCGFDELDAGEMVDLDVLTKCFDIGWDWFKSDYMARRSDFFSEGQRNVADVRADIIDGVSDFDVFSDGPLQVALVGSQQITEMFCWGNTEVATGGKSSKDLSWPSFAPQQEHNARLSDAFDGEHLKSPILNQGNEANHFVRRHDWTSVDHSDQLQLLRVSRSDGNHHSAVV